MEMQTEHRCTCQNCLKSYVFNAEQVDTTIHCACGFSFYIFIDQGLTVAIPLEEMQYRGVSSALWNLIASYGRIPNSDLPDGAVDYYAVLREANPEWLTEISLTRLQEETYGKKILSAWHVEALCESLISGTDVAIRYKKDKDRIVMNPLNYQDLLAKWQKKHDDDTRSEDHHEVQDERTA